MRTITTRFANARLGQWAAAEKTAREATQRPGNSSDLNVESLRHAAAAAVATSHHCAQLLKALACTPEAFGPVQPTAELDHAAQTAAQARDSWWCRVAGRNRLRPYSPSYGESRY